MLVYVLFAQVSGHECAANTVDLDHSADESVVCGLVSSFVCQFYQKQRTQTNEEHGAPMKVCEIFYLMGLTHYFVI